MSNYNSGAIYNRDGRQGGATYNSEYYIVIVRLKELIKAKDELSEILVKLILEEADIFTIDNLILNALYDNISPDSFKMEESDVKVSLLFKMAEEMGLKDDLTDFIVLLYLNEKVKLIEDLKTFATIVTEDDINAFEKFDIKAFLKLLDKFGFEDLMTYFCLFEEHDFFGMTDREPKTAISDFLIGHSDLVDVSYDWLLPFGLKVDWNQSSIQVMPPAELTTVEFPGADGSIVEDTVYKDRIFSIVGFSEMGLTTYEKEVLKAKITDILDSTKNKTKRLTVQARGVTFDAKYTDQAEIVDGPSYVKASIDFHVPPYGYEMFSEEIYGSGLIYNSGDTLMRPTFIISGYVSKPYFNFAGNTYRYNGVVQSNQKLVINFEMMTCYITDGVKKTNAMANFVGNFIGIEPGKSAVLNASSIESKIKTEYRNRVLW